MSAVCINCYAETVRIKGW